MQPGYKKIKSKLKTRILSPSRPISVIIPIHNGYEFFPTLVASIYKNTNIPFQIIIIDDASDDPKLMRYLDDLVTNYPPESVRILRNDVNLGFVKSINLASQYTNDHFVILNSDTEVPENWLIRLIQPILEDESIASVTPLSNSGSICSFPIPYKNNPLYLGLSLATLDGIFQKIGINTKIDTPTGVGFCMSINHSVWSKIGPFDERYGLGYAEENDWCMRAYHAGFTNIITPNLFVFHYHGASFNAQTRLKLESKNHPLLLQRYPEYPDLIRKFNEGDPLQKIRNSAAIASMVRASNGRCSFLFRNLEKKHSRENNYSEIVAAEKPLLILEFDSKNSLFVLSAFYLNWSFEVEFIDQRKVYEFLDLLELKIIKLMTDNQLIEMKIR